MIENVKVLKTSDGKLFENECSAYKHECEYLQGIVNDYRELYYTSEDIKIDYVEKYKLSEINNSISCAPQGQGIYMWFDINNGKGYVGSTKDLRKRFREFLNPNCRYGGDKVEEARKYTNNFIYFVLEKVYDTESKYMGVLERYYMTKYNTIDNGYNTKLPISNGCYVY